MKFHVIKNLPVEVTMEDSSPLVLKLLNFAGLKSIAPILYLAMSVAFSYSLRGFGFSFPMRNSKPVLPLLHCVGMHKRYVYVVASTQRPSLLTSTDLMGSPRPGSKVLAS